MLTKRLKSPVLLLCVGVLFISTNRIHSSSDRDFKGILKQDGSPKNFSRSVAFKSIPRGGIQETIIYPDRALELLPIIISQHVPPADDILPSDNNQNDDKNYIQKSLSQPKSVARYPVRPKNVEHYAQGWRSSRRLTHEAREHNGKQKPRPTTYGQDFLSRDSNISDNPHFSTWLRIQEKRERENPKQSYFSDPELGWLDTDESDEWIWISKYRDTIEVDPKWLFDQQQLLRSNRYVWKPGAREFIKEMIESLHVHADSWGTVIKVVPVEYDLNMGNFVYVRHVQDNFGYIWQIDSGYFDGQTRELTQHAQDILQQFRDRMPSYEVLKGSTYGNRGIWLISMVKNEK